MSAPPHPRPPAGEARERVLLALQRDAAGRQQHAHEHQRNAHRDDHRERVQRRAPAVQQRALDLDRLADRRQHVLGEARFCAAKSAKAVDPFAAAARSGPGGWRAMIRAERRGIWLRPIRFAGAPSTPRLPPREQQRRSPCAAALAGSVRRSRGSPARAPSRASSARATARARCRCRALPAAPARRRRTAARRCRAGSRPRRAPRRTRPWRSPARAWRTRTAWTWLNSCCGVLAHLRRARCPPAIVCPGGVSSTIATFGCDGPREIAKPISSAIATGYTTSSPPAAASGRGSADPCAAAQPHAVCPRSCRNATNALSRSPSPDRCAAISSAGVPSNSSSPSASTIARAGVAAHLAEVVGGEQHARACDRSRARRRTPTAVRAGRGSSAEDGSSSASTCGSAINPRATFTRWRLPPDRRSTRSSRALAEAPSARASSRPPPRGRPLPRGARTARGSRRPTASRTAPAAAAPSRSRAPAPEPDTVPRAWLLDAGENRQQRRLAGAVGPDDRNQLAGAYVEARRRAAPPARHSAWRDPVHEITGGPRSQDVHCEPPASAPTARVPDGGQDRRRSRAGSTGSAARCSAPTDPCSCSPSSSAKITSSGLMRSVCPKICGATTCPSSCCRPRNSSATHTRSDRVGEQRDQDRRQRAQKRADVGNQLHETEEHAERNRVRAPVGKDPEHAEQVQRDARGRAHDHAEQQLPADVARNRTLDERRVVVGGGAVAVGHRPTHERADALPVQEHVHAQHEHEHEVEDRARGFRQQRRHRTRRSSPRSCRACPGSSAAPSCPA